MKLCPKGAIVNPKEIALLLLALAAAVAWTELLKQRSWGSRADLKKRAEYRRLSLRFRALHDRLKKSADEHPRSSALKGS